MAQRQLSAFKRPAFQPVVCVRTSGGRRFEVPLSGEEMRERYGKRWARGGSKQDPHLKTMTEAKKLAAKILRENPEEDNVTVWAIGDQVVECRPLGDIPEYERWGVLAGRRGVVVR